MRLNKKGFTLIELIVSIGLLSIVMVFMVNLFMETRTMFNDSKAITVFESDKRYMLKSLSSDLSDYTIENVNTFPNKLEFRFKELGETKTLKIIQQEDGKTYLFYGCESNCNSATKSIATYKNLIPEGSVIGNIDFKKASQDSKLGHIKIPIKIAGKDQSFNVYYSFKEVDNYDSYYLTDSLFKLVQNASDDTTNTITIKEPVTDASGLVCTNTVAFDGTDDNNLRYVGTNPCNFISFNGESPTVSTKWVYKNSDTGASYATFNTKSDCEDFYPYGSNYINKECVQETVVTGGWRIIGVMNNVDNGNGKKETRIKITRAVPFEYTDGHVTYYTFNPCPNYLEPYATNDYSKSGLVDLLNNNYLGGLAASNGLDDMYNLSPLLSEEAQSLIGDAKWYLGNFNSYLDSNHSVNNFYRAERGNKTWGSYEDQICNDGACPRATQWTGKVALSYPSDYGFASNASDKDYCLDNILNPFQYYYYTYYDKQNGYDAKLINCFKNDWLSNRLFLTGDSYMSYHIYSSQPDYPFFGSTSFSDRYPVHPTVYLRSDVIFTGGDGSIEDPFTIALDD